jgi:integrase/recombinase XerD
MTENVVDLKKDKVKIAYGSEEQVEVYSDNQLERIQFYIQNQKKVTLRDKMIIQLLMFTGVRVSELCNIKLKNINYLLSQIKIIGKGGKVREVPVKFEVMDTIQEYISERNNNPYKTSEYLILGQRGAIRRDAVNTLLERHTLKGNFEIKLKPHTFRHTFCTRLINNYKEIIELTNVSNELKEELLTYFQEIAEGIVGEAWKEYNLSEVGSIAVIEDDDTIKVLDKFGLMQGNNFPVVLPEFATKIITGETEMLKIIWVFGDCNGVSVYYPVGKFGEEFDAWIADYLID